MPDETLHPFSRYVFVYGTLRRGGSNDITRLAPPAIFLGEAFVRGTLYDLGAYPGIALHLVDSAEHGDFSVRGEIYAISPELERRLDEIEGLLPEPNGEYQKREITVLLDGQHLECLVYEINSEHLENAIRIAHGDWMKDRRL
ncbi:gamma-glutamylcyclotransferase family protein [Acidovorax sp. NCPPB 3576]|uniref:gamma-glutamylcyclotransferase family protein n=1 Tax=Acidovorax sp. NCPPB 3576 TaxID=2940488 RepID=UPI00234A2BFA|nr:gamma-glutamylcyclotransferase family protein [Acidovorax sp. NCPPB 3576]WCM90158.1 gamma-glutamylcyclotransferase [Acidovorax sp. NCPPB 3576]